jgi:GNAT superfamily N-acetyltransferase
MSREPLKPTQIRLAIPADAGMIARVSIASWRTTYRGLISEDYLQNLSYRHRRDNWLDRLSRQDGSFFAYVAVNSAGKIVGFASGGRERAGDANYQGELYALYLLASAQRQGLGRQLLLAVAHHLLKQSMTTMVIWALRENPARRFYEAMGGKYVREQPVQIGDEILQELAYGWDNLPDFLSSK